MSRETPSTAFTTRFSGFVPKSLSNSPPPPRSKCTFRSRIESRVGLLTLINGFSHAAAQRRNERRREHCLERGRRRAVATLREKFFVSLMKHHPLRCRPRGRNDRANSDRR